MQKIIPFARALSLVTILAVAATLIMACGKEESQPLPQKAEIGKPAPNFNLTDLDGKQWQLSDLRGKVVFVNFWATWCPPCVEEMPDMVALDKKMSKAPFKMITILSNDRPDFAAQMIKKVGASFPVLIDPDSLVGSQYGLTGVPETFIIDAQGILREKFLGPRPWNSPEALNMLGQYLPQ